jgi:hypothetical protein
MIIGKFTSYPVIYGCKKPDGNRYWQYTASTGGYQVTGYGTTCDAAKADWEKLASKKHPDYTAKGGGTSANSVKQAQNPYIVPYIPKSQPSQNGGLSANSVKQAQAKGSSNTPASIFEPIFGTGKAGMSASGKAGAGVTAGASISATVSDLQAKANQTVSDILPDSIESSIEGAGIPLWMLPVGIVGAGLLLILLVRR